VWTGIAPDFGRVQMPVSRERSNRCGTQDAAQNRRGQIEPRKKHRGRAEFFALPMMGPVARLHRLLAIGYLVASLRRATARPLLPRADPTPFVFWIEPLNRFAAPGQHSLKILEHDPGRYF
jgi:hypothetical protein